MYVVMMSDSIGFCDCYVVVVTVFAWIAKIWKAVCVCLELSTIGVVKVIMTLWRDWTNGAFQPSVFA